MNETNKPKGLNMKELKELTKIAPGVLDKIRSGLNLKNELKAEYQNGKIVISFKPVQTWKKERAIKDDQGKWKTDGSFSRVLIGSNRYGGGMHVKLPNGQTVVVKIDAALIDEQARVEGAVPQDYFEAVSAE